MKAESLCGTPETNKMLHVILPHQKIKKKKPLTICALMNQCDSELHFIKSVRRYFFSAFSTSALQDQLWICLLYFIKLRVS